MKNLLVFVLACLASTTMFAQYHYTVNTSGCAGTNTTMTCFLYIDHVVQDDIDGFEIGVFDIDEGLCRGRALSKTNAAIEHPFFQITIKGNEGFSYTFKIYNHNTEEELTLVPDLNEEITWGSGKKYGTIVTPYELNFTDPAQAGYTLEITPYEDPEGRDNYYLIASPVGAIAADQVTNLTSNSYDLYSFDQAAELEWVNHVGEEGFTLQPNVGYLYANSGDGENDVVTLTFNGTPTTEEFVTVNLTQADAAEGLDFPDWNLVGNPFEVVAYPNQPFYSMVNGAFVSNAANAELPAMNGAFVVRTDEVTSVTFSKVPANKVQLLALNLSTNGKVLDRAIVSFGQGQQLPKFQLFKNSSKLYIPQDGNDYAVVTSEGMGEMPVSFKAESNGTYSLTLSTENVEFSYLHLIDNLTGADQDLLANPSYSFSANTTDYDSRFRLVFATGNDEDSFAFFSNGSLFVNNEGSAVLQVVDVTGRIVKSESINGCASVSFDAAPGVYMVRLVNGDNMKVQKVVK